MPLLEVENLTTHFHTRDGVVKAVDGINFSVDNGETLAIVGESGSGKSVACYSLLNLIPQPPGKIESGTALFEDRHQQKKIFSKPAKRIYKKFVVTMLPSSSRTR